MEGNYMHSLTHLVSITVLSLPTYIVVGTCIEVYRKVMLNSEKALSCHCKTRVSLPGLASKFTSQSWSTLTVMYLHTIHVTTKPTTATKILITYCTKSRSKPDIGVTWQTSMVLNHVLPNQPQWTNVAQLWLTLSKAVSWSLISTHT